MNRPSVKALRERRERASIHTALAAAIAASRSSMLIDDREPERPSAPNEKRSAPAASPWTDGELEALVQFRLDAAINEGHPPRNIQAFLADQRKRELANEAARPGWVRRCAAGIAAHREGKRITGYRWVRGTHAGAFVRDPYGTDELPKGHAA